MSCTIYKKQEMADLREKMKQNSLLDEREDLRCTRSPYPLRTMPDYDESDDEINMRPYSVTSYFVQHSKRKNRGNFLQHVWNDLAPMLTTRNRARFTGPHHTRRIGRYNSELLGGVADSKRSRKGEKEPSRTEQKLPDEERNTISDITPISSPPPSMANEGVRRKRIHFPIVTLRRPQVARNNEIIRYSDVPLLRRQTSDLISQRQKQKFREDFARTSYDINRLKLNRPQTANSRFRDICTTYLATTPGARSAITSQMG